MVWTTSYYHYDAVGSTRTLTGADQSIQASYRQQAFGQPLLSNATVNPFRFVGQLGYYHDAATGLVNVRQRVYDANTARWLSQDPVESEHNLFRYASNNPLTLIDPAGLYESLEALAMMPMASDAYRSSYDLGFGGDPQQMILELNSPAPTPILDMKPFTLDELRVAQWNAYLREMREEASLNNVMHRYFSEESIQAGVVRRSKEMQTIAETQYLVNNGTPGQAFSAYLALELHTIAESAHPMYGQLNAWQKVLDDKATGSEKAVAVGLGLFDTLLQVVGTSRPRPIATTETGGALRFVEREGGATTGRTTSVSGEWQVLKGGGLYKWQQYVVRVKKVGNYWVKEINPEASLSGRQFAQRGLEEQVKGLKQLGEQAPSFLYRNGRLVTRDVGRFSGSGLDWLRIRIRGSWRLGTPFNDIVKRNIGATGQIFDPKINPYYTIRVGESIRGAGYIGDRILINAVEDPK